MRKLKAMVIEDDINQMESLVNQLNKIGFHEIIFAIDKASIVKFSNWETPPLILVFSNQTANVPLSDYLNEFKPTTSIILCSFNHLDKIAFLNSKPSFEKIEYLNGNRDFICSQRKFKDDVIFIKVGKVYKRILLNEIDYIHYADRHANIKIGEKEMPVKIPMKELAKSLPKEKFIQIHQGHIINLSKLNQISIVNNQVEIKGKWLPIGIKFLKKFKEQMPLFS